MYVNMYVCMYVSMYVSMHVCFIYAHLDCCIAMLCYTVDILASMFVSVCRGLCPVRLVYCALCTVCPHFVILIKIRQTWQIIYVQPQVQFSLHLALSGWIFIEVKKSVDRAL